MKRADIKRRPLADTVLASLEPEEKEYREAYGIDRMYFVVSPNGRKRWEMRHKKPDGKWSWLGLGGYPEYSAKKAREKVHHLTGLIHQGVDPAQHKQAAKKAIAVREANTFRAAAEAWYEKKVADHRAPTTLETIRNGLDNDILPILGGLPIDSITRKDCAHVQAEVEKRGALVVAKNTRGWVNQIFRMAIARGLCENNPASELLSLAVVVPSAKPHPHLLEHELPDFILALRNSTSRIIGRTAAWLAIWTASRPGVVRHAEWSEMDLDNGVWRVAAKKMKMRKDHHSPLPTQAIAALRELHKITGHQKYVFPGGFTKDVIGESSINFLFGNLGYAGRLVGHGTRHTASTLLREHEWAKDYVEAQLAHTEAGMAGIYNKAQYMPQRVSMMQWYADYLDALADGLTPELRAQFKARVNN